MTILWKYVIIYTYLLLVMGVSFVVSKRTQNNEVSRNIVHICAGLGWILYRLLFPATIHPIIFAAASPHERQVIAIPNISNRKREL